MFEHLPEQDATRLESLTVDWTDSDRADFASRIKLFTLETTWIEGMPEWLKGSDNDSD